jgi:hypothetical protein
MYEALDDGRLLETRPGYSKGDLDSNWDLYAQSSLFRMEHTGKMTFLSLPEVKLLLQTAWSDFMFFASIRDGSQSPGKSCDLDKMAEEPIPGTGDLVFSCNKSLEKFNEYVVQTTMGLKHEKIWPKVVEMYFNGITKMWWCPCWNNHLCEILEAVMKSKCCVEGSFKKVLPLLQYTLRSNLSQGTGSGTATPKSVRSFCPQSEKANKIVEIKAIEPDEVICITPKVINDIVELLETKIEKSSEKWQILNNFAVYIIEVNSHLTSGKSEETRQVVPQHKTSGCSHKHPHFPTSVKLLSFHHRCIPEALDHQKSNAFFKLKVIKELFLERLVLLLGNLWTEACADPALLVFDILQKSAKEVDDLGPEIPITAKAKTMRFKSCRLIHDLWELNIVKKTMDLYRPKG